MNLNPSNTNQDQLNKQLQTCKALLKKQPKEFLEACQTLIKKAEENKLPLIEAKAKLLLGQYYLV